jgi:regulator of sigma E protease
MHPQAPKQVGKLLETIVSGVIVFSILVVVHELGHFIFAKRVGVKVLEFAFGYPPRIFAVKRGDTEYALNLIPFGGYVRMLGEDNPAEGEGSLASKTPWQRFQVLAAGAGMNLLLSIVFFAATFLLGVATSEPSQDVLIAGVVRDGPAAAAGLQINDAVLRVNASAVKTVADLQRLTQENAGQQISLIIRRDGEVLDPVLITPRASPPTGQGPLGIQIANYRMVIRQYNLFEAIWMGAERTVSVIGLTLYTPVLIMKGLVPADLARPIGVVGMTQLTGAVVSQIPTSGWVPVLNLIGLLNAGLGIAQLLPIPGLDGGRLVFVFLEWIRRGKRISAEKEGMVHLAGMVLLLALMIVITYYDIVNPINLPELGMP